MKLGKLQRMWVERLKSNPELQTKRILGSGDSKNYKACCLGELILCDYRIKKKKFPFFHKELIVEGRKQTVQKYEEYGLRNESGYLKNPIKIDSMLYYSLANLNDVIMSWKEIGEYIENNSENVFTKSV